MIKKRRISVGDCPKVSKKKVAKKAKPKDNTSRISYGKGLCHKQSITVKISGVNNGYCVTIGSDSYVFSEKEELAEFLLGELPLKGTDQDFIDCLDDECEEGIDLFEDDGPPF